MHILLELLGYMIWGILELAFAGANATFIGTLLGFLAAIFLFSSMQSSWLAGLASVGVITVTAGLGVLIDSAIGTK